MATNTRLTYADYEAFPDDGNRYEIIDGEMYMSPPPSRAHQWASVALVRLISTHVVERKLGELYHAPFAVILGPNDVYEPDLIFVSAARTMFIDDRGVYGAPDLCIEIASPSTRTRDRTTKYERYAHFGVLEYWLVDTEKRAIEVFGLEGHAYILRGVAHDRDRVPSRVLPDLRLRALSIFLPDI